MRNLGSPEDCLRFCREAPRPLVLVPTMGALHDGHAALLEKGRALAGKTGTLVSSIFVNPIQFAPSEDLSRYPRTPEADLALCERYGVDAVFSPSPESMYRPDRSVFVDETSLSSVLCGASRPGHFRGVCTVVAKLFHLTATDLAVFGEKDWQQLAILRKMVRDLDFPIEIVACPTVREADGLALSSRNRYLSAEERSSAPGIYAALLEAKKNAEAPDATPAIVQEKLKKTLSALPNATVDYAEVVDEESLRQPEIFAARTRAIVAVRFPSARLIDNLAVFSPQ